MSDQEAILLCRDWMVFLGATDTVVASEPAHRLCDLYSAHYVVWVDNQEGNLDVDAVERAASVTAADGRDALIFVSGGVRPVAQKLADILGVAILLYDARDGDLYGGNTVGRRLCSSGLTSK